MSRGQPDQSRKRWLAGSAMLTAASYTTYLGIRWLRSRGSGERSGPIQRLSSTVADPSLPAYIAGVMIVEPGPLLDASGRLRLDEIRSRLDRRLSHLPQMKRLAYFPGFLQGRPFWGDDPEFDLGRHIREGAVDPPGGEAELLVAAEHILRDQLDPARPPWELWLLTGLADGRLALLLKLHHAIADGLGAVAIMTTLFDLAPTVPDPPSLPWTPVPPPSRRALLADNLAAKAALAAGGLRALRHPRRLATVLTDIWRNITIGSRAPATSFNQPVPPGSSDLVRVLHMDLELARAAAHTAGAKINDLLLDIAAGGVRELLIARGEQVTGLELVAMVPVTLRSSTEARALGNQAGFMLVPLPVGEADSNRRLRLIAGATRRAKAAQRPEYFQVLGALSVVSAKVAPALMEHQRFMNLIATNVPGPTDPLYLLGARVLDVIPLLGGLLGGNVTLCFCALSYVGGLSLTVITDATAVPDIDLVLQGMKRAWNELAWQTAASR